MEEVKKEDVEAARNFLQAVGSAFAMQASMITGLEQYGASLSPVVYYPDSGRAIYIGLKLELPDEETAKYMNKCFEIAARGESE